MTLKAFESKTKQASKLLKLLANEKRLQILCKLAENESTSVTELSQYVGLSQSALSQHLAKMREQNIISTRREAQTIYYKIDNDDVAKIMITLRNIYC